MRHKKHHRKSSPWIPAIVMLILAILIGLETYLLFFHNNPISQQNPTRSTTETTRSPIALTKDADHAENFKQEVQPDSDFAKEFDQTLTDNQFVGTALIIHNGQIILQKGFGQANVAKNLPNTSQSNFQIGSIQKAMTAVLILQQVQAKKISLDDTLDKFYPNITDSFKITIRQLLSMCSGLYQKEQPTVAMSDDDFLRFSISNAAMGTYGKYKYEAVNYRILAGILEKLTNTSYRTLFEQTFIQQLHLSNTFFYDDFLSSLNRTYAYKKPDETGVASEINDNHLLFAQEVGTGNIGMTVGDLYLFYSNLLEGNIIDQKTIDKLWTPDTFKKYMGGLYNFPDYIKGHGSEAGFESTALISKNRQNVVLLLSNQSSKRTSHEELASSIFNLLGPYQSK
ncbi:serine hydrolase domain-containing protein [Candidatus Enterococcus lemimoniae]|uniref:Beta-lactamase-related domain-containing protein n=1 Tax=Candidatus Enterococcus lemimoniae TaxID=1834167 RepID=A0ABZ2T9C0_9ENTE|nr:serine hydrolase domain-containing protein [Enterococcus sp. 12C11_DIV0727]OTO70105.1 hypothetical protein A5866_002323 [Enterococcus sp. 12C11_DIV0727]